MNEYDIWSATSRWGYDPVLGPAARTLKNLMDAVNANSDGWAYWQAPRKASKRLQEVLGMVDKARRDGQHTPLREELREAYKASLPALKRFRTKHGIHFEIEDPK